MYCPHNQYQLRVQPADSILADDFTYYFICITQTTGIDFQQIFRMMYPHTAGGVVRAIQPCIRM